MLWSQVKSWAKSKGYETFREKSSSQTHEYEYYWGSVDDSSISGMECSVSKLATSIFNHMTDNRFVEHQERYRQKKANEDINREGLSESW